MTPESSALPAPGRGSGRPPWDAVCERFRLVLRGLLIRLGAARLVVFMLAVVTAALVVDWRVNLSAPVRLIILLVFLGGVAAAVMGEFRRHLRRAWTDAEVLRYLDSLRPEGEDALLVLHELHHGEGVEEARSAVGKSLLEQATAELDPALAAAKPKAAVSRRRVRRWEVSALVALVLAVGLTAAFSRYVGTGLVRFFNPFTSVRWPHRTTVTIVGAPADRRWPVPQGKALTVEATVRGLEVPPTVTLYTRPLTGRRRYIPQTLTVRPHPEGGGMVRHTFSELGEDLEFYLVGGDHETEAYTVDVIPAPQLVLIQGTYRYPSYAALPERIITGGDVRGLENTRVHLEFTASVDLKEATFQLNQDTPVRLALATPKTFSTDLTLSKNGSYRVRLVDTNGLTEIRPERYEISVTPDEPPVAEVVEPAVDLEATPVAAFRVTIRAGDDFGLSEVKFLVAEGGKPPVVLSDKITGPIPQRGLLSSQTFTWDLTGLKLTPPTRLLCVVRARDVNPSGTGVTDSRPLSIEVLKPSEFHLRLFQQAKAILTEARLAYVNQKAAYDRSDTWPVRGTGADKDPLWLELTDHQQRSERAASKMKDLMTEFYLQMERNRLSQPACKGRLDSISALLNQVVSAYHPAIRQALRAATPRNDSEAAPDALKARRTAAAGASRDQQKMSALILARMLRKLYDWRDLQSAYIQATLLAERQTEVSAITQKVGPLYQGREIEDLTDKEQDQLLTLAKQQEAIYDSEKALEQELMQIIKNADDKGRLWIGVPIKDAFTWLRDKQVNEKLKDAYLKIGNNQPFMVYNQQREATVALEEVRAGLALAGHHEEKEAPIALEQPLTEADLELAAAVDVTREVTPDEQLTEVQIRDLVSKARQERQDLPASDALAISIQTLVDLQDAVLKRTRYLDANRGPTEMPRFIRLKLGMLGERQGDALKGADTSLDLAAKAKAAVATSVLTASRAEMQQVAGLLGAAEVGPTVQQIQDDLANTLRDLKGVLGRQNEVTQTAEKHTAEGGMDPFKRKYILRDQDLTLAVEMARFCDEAHVWTGDVSRKARRALTAADTESALVKKAEAASRAAAAKTYTSVAALLAETQKRVTGFSPAVKPRIQERTALTEVASLFPAGGDRRLAAGPLDAALVDGLSKSGEGFRTVVRQLLDLMDEREEAREAPPVTVAPIIPVATRPVTPEEELASITPEVLEKVLKESPGLPEALRERMIESLKFGLNPKYKRALAAYYAAIAREAKKAGEGNVEPPVP